MMGSFLLPLKLIFIPTIFMQNGGANMIDKDLLKEMVHVSDVADALGLRTAYRSGKVWLECPNHVKELGKADSHLTNCIISKDDMTYYCFGCSSGGDIFTMVENQMGISFREAMQWVIDTFGINEESITMDADTAANIAESTSLRPFFELLGLAPQSPAEYVTQEYLTEEDIPATMPFGSYIKKDVLPNDMVVYQKCNHLKESLLQLKSEDPEAYQYLISSKLAEVNKRLEEQEKIAKTMTNRYFYESCMAQIKKDRETIAFANW